ncbi:MAG: hypothetical protein MJ252_12990, partial [archaeon]|nr:hypothetical protein [archaeon]
MDLMDYLIDNGKMPLWIQLASRDFIVPLAKMLKNRDYADVNYKILYLIKKWGLKFDKYHSTIPNYSAIYQELFIGGVEFPDGNLSSYQNYLNEEGKSKTQYNSRDDFDDDSEDSENGDVQISASEYRSSIALDLNKHHYEDKYKRLVAKIDEVITQIGELNCLMDHWNNRTVRSDAKRRIDPLKKNKRQIDVTIESGKIKDNRLQEMTLGIDEDINQTLERYDNIIRKNRNEPFTSFFILQKAQLGEDIPIQRKKSKKKEKEKEKKNTEVDLLDIFGDSSQPMQTMPNNPSNANNFFDFFGDSNSNQMGNNYNNGNNYDNFDFQGNNQGMNMN